MKSIHKISKSAFLVIGALSLLLSPAFAAEESVASGTFEGKSKHKTSGSVSIVKTATGFTVKLGDDFKFDGAPAPRLGLGKGGYKSDTQFSKLNKNKGAQTYELPSRIDASKYDEVWIWCEKYDVPLGLASLK